MVDVFRVRDAEALGFSDGFVRAQLEARRWQKRLRGVVITNNGTPTLDVAEKEALLYADGHTRGVAYLCGPSAARKHGWEVPAPGEVHVATSARVASVDGIVRIKHTRRIGIRDVLVVGGVRVGSPIRTLVDLAQEWPEKELRHLVPKLVQQHKLPAGYLAQELERLVRQPHTRDLRGIVGAVVRGARAGGEIRLLNGLAARGWHLEPNGYVERREGGSRQGDLLSRILRLVIQVESMGFHASYPHVVSDASRDMDYLRARFVTIRAWTTRIEDDLENLLDEIVATLEARADELGVPREVAMGRPSEPISA